MVQSSFVSFFESPGLTSPTCHTCGPSISATQIFFSLPKSISEPVNRRASPAPDAVHVTSWSRFSKTHIAIASPFPARWSRKFSLGSSAAADGIFAASITMSSEKKSGSTT